MSNYAQQIEFLISENEDAALGTATVYLAGTSTLATIYTARDKSVIAANPYTLNANGSALLYADGVVKIDVKDSAGVSVPGFPRDNLSFGLQNGPWVDVEGYASLTAAIAAIGSTETTLLVDSTTLLTSNTVVPSNIELQVTIKGYINLNGYTLTGLKEGRPEWFGADSTGVADSLAAFKAADDNTNCKITTPGTYLISDTVTLAKQWELGPGVIIKPAATKTVTFSKAVTISDNGQHFDADMSTTGTVILANREQTPDWWGTGLLAIHSATNSLANGGLRTGGALILNKSQYVTSGDIHLYNDIQIVGSIYSSEIYLANGSNAHMFNEASARSRVSFDRVWLNGNKANQTGNWRGINAATLYQSRIPELHCINFGGAGVYIASATALSVGKIDCTYCGDDEPAIYLPDFTTAQEITATGDSVTAYTTPAVSIGSSSFISYVYLENNPAFVFRGDDSVVEAAYTIGTPVFLGNNNHLGKVRPSIPQRWQDSGHHNTIDGMTLYNKHSALELFNTSDNVNPYFFSGTTSWTNLTYLRPFTKMGKAKGYFPSHWGVLTTTTAATKAVSCDASTDYVVESFHMTPNATNTIRYEVVDQAATALYDSGTLTNGYASSAAYAVKHVGVLRTAAGSTTLTAKATAGGTAVDSTLATFFGYRLTKSLLANGGMEATTGGTATGWTLSGGTGTQETTEVRPGSGASQKIVTTAAAVTFTSTAMTLVTGKAYVVSGYIKIASGDANVRVGIGDASSGNTRITMKEGADADGWQNFTFVISDDDFSAGALNTVQIYVPAATTIYVDDIYCYELERTGV